MASNTIDAAFDRVFQVQDDVGTILSIEGRDLVLEREEGEERPIR
jgi:hypothetical protein